MIQFATTYCNGEPSLTLYQSDTQYECELRREDKQLIETAISRMSGSSIQSKKLGAFTSNTGLSQNAARVLYAAIHRVVPQLNAVLNGLELRSIYVRKGVFGLSHALELISEVGVVIHLHRRVKHRVYTAFLMDSSQTLYVAARGSKPVVETTHLSDVGRVVPQCLFEIYK